MGTLHLLQNHSIDCWVSQSSSVANSRGISVRAQSSPSRSGHRSHCSLSDNTGSSMAHQDHYYAEESFSGLQNTGRIYTGPLLGVGVASILSCFAMSTITKRSPNLAFRWLQRRVGAQFMTIAYFFTCNLLYFHDGKHWRTRDVNDLAKRAYGPLLLQYERRKRAAAKRATDSITGGLNQQE